MKNEQFENCPFGQRCPKCGEVATTDKDQVSEGYYAACLVCDEDFYKIELV